uniref:FxSxx-COOH system tetratricopeptide repeat protein n=1 Tax=Actinacidiphila yanglinensis TaxID=310779 RepID=UPI000CDEC81F
MPRPRRAAHGGPSGVPGAPPEHVTLSYAGPNRAWAVWIGALLERHGVRVSMQRWDVAPRAGIEEGLRDLLLSGGTALLVLSESYVAGRPAREWNSALRAVVPPNSDRIAAVSLTPAALPSATALLAASDLWALDAGEAERRVLVRLGIPPGEDDAAAGSGRPGPRYPLEQPAVWGEVPPRNRRFTGRESLLFGLHEQLSGAEPGAGVATLHGLSGVGKTHIATEYAYRFGPEYDVVWWVRASERGTLREKLAGLAPALGLVTGREYGERLRAVRDALRRGEPYLRWLVVLDGADYPEDVHDLVPTGPGHVLITSQNRGWGEHNSALIEVPVYTRDESVAFVRRRAPRLDAADAEKLAEVLGDLALALDQNAGALDDSNMLVDEYVELLRRGADVESGLKVAPDFRMTYFTAFSILLNRLGEDRPEAVELLRLCVFFAPGPIPVRLLRGVPGADATPELARLTADPEIWDAAIEKLAQWSVIQSDPRQTTAEEPSGAGEAIQMHRLVHQAVRNEMAPDEYGRYARAVGGALVAADPGRPNDPSQWARYAEIVPHLEASGALVSTVPAVRTTVIRCLRYLFLSGEYGAGLRIASRANEYWPQMLDPGDSLLWDLSHNRANLLRALGEYTESETLDRAAYEQLSADRDGTDPLVLRAAGSLAADLRHLGHYGEALEFAELVEDGYAATDDTGGGLMARNNTAVTYRLLGRYADALRLDQETLGALGTWLGPRHARTLSSQDSHAHDLRLLGRYGEALRAQERTCALHAEVLGPDNPQSLRAEHNLAECERHAGDRARAFATLGRLLNRCERVLGDTDPLTLRVAASYSCHERAHGDPDRARELAASVLDRYRRQLGVRHPYTAGALANHALVRRVAGEWDEACAEAEEALDAMGLALGEAHPWALGCALNAAVARLAVGRGADATALSRATDATAADVLGGEHPLTLACRTALVACLREGGALGEEGTLGEADAIERRVLDDLTRTLGTGHPRTVEARSRALPYWDFEAFSA